MHSLWSLGSVEVICVLGWGVNWQLFVTFIWHLPASPFEDKRVSRWWKLARKTVSVKLLPAPLLHTCQLVIESLRFKGKADKNNFLKLVTVVEYLWPLLEALILYLTSFFFEDTQADESWRATSVKLNQGQNEPSTQCSLPKWSAPREILEHESSQNSFNYLFLLSARTPVTNTSGSTSLLSPSGLAH